MTSAEIPEYLLRHALVLAGVKPHKIPNILPFIPRERRQTVAHVPATRPGGDGAETDSQTRKNEPAPADDEQLRSDLLQSLLSVQGSVLAPYAPIRAISRAVQLATHEMPFIVILSGASGCGKSTLTSLLASRLGISCVLSTDAVRSALRNLKNTQPSEAPLLQSQDASSLLERSTYELTLEEYIRQCELVCEHLPPLIAARVKRRVPVIVEGVHLLPSLVDKMMRRIFSEVATGSSSSSETAVSADECVYRFVVYISNSEKHRERFATRSKYMTLDARFNRYVSHFDAIRRIQDRLVAEASSSLSSLSLSSLSYFEWSKVDNTNIDRSMALIHSKILGH